MDGYWAMGVLQVFDKSFLVCVDVVVYGGLPLGVALGWYAVYRLWKQYFYRKPIANARQIIRLLGSLLFVALVAFSTYLFFVMVSYVLTH
jgi:hypothetical protein